MIAFHDCYYIQLFFSRRSVFSSARWPIKILERVKFFRRLVEPTKISTIIFVGLRDR
jgi:hypothetical protein